MPRARLGNECLNWHFNNGLAASRALRSGPKNKSKEERKAIAAKVKPEFIPLAENWDPLSGNLRDTVRSEAGDLWKKFGRRVLAGYGPFPAFDAEHPRKSALRLRDGAAEIVRDGDWYTLRLQRFPGREDNWLSLPVYKFTEKKKLYITELLSRMADGETPILKTTVTFDRHKKSVVMARLAYSKQIDEPDPDMTAYARIGPVGESGELYLRVEGPAYSFEERRRLASMTATVQMMADKKVNISGIWQRVRLSKKRKAMTRLKTFEEWSVGPCHQLSAAIVGFCASRKVKDLEWLISSANEVRTVGLGGKEEWVSLPWAKIRFQVEYKGREHGVEIINEKELLDKLAEGAVR